jgi:SAM-dependent methyltransferase
MHHIDVAGFDLKFRGNVDPWNYRHSRFEHQKRKVLIEACGCAKRGRGLELACANGETTRELSQLCLKLTAIDGSPTALAEAQRRHGHIQGLKFLRASLPTEMPKGPFDLIVVSEIAYYLRSHDLARLARNLPYALAPGGRVIVLDHRRRFPDAAQHSGRAHQMLCALLRRSLRRVARSSYAQYDVAAFEKGLRASSRYVPIK